MSVISERVTLPIAAIRTDGGTQPRAELNQETLQDYAQSMMEGAIFPPITVFYDGSDYWLADGFHRYHATIQICRDDINAEIKQGSRLEAVWYSLGANKTHGLRLSNADKNRIVSTALGNWPERSDGEIARQCGVSDRFVAKKRCEMTPNRSESNIRIGSDGRIYNTSNIGQAQTIPAKQAFEEIAPGFTQWQRERETPTLPPTWNHINGKTFDAPLPDGKPVNVPEEWKLPSSLRTEPFIDDEEEQEDRYDGSKPAHCKYCYATHDDWYPSEIGWECKKCGYSTADEYMQIEGVKPSEEQEAFEKQLPPETRGEVSIKSAALTALQSSESVEWYTPSAYVDAARDLLGGIDLDPASNELANKVVQASEYYDVNTNGLDKPWSGRIWLNPPYGITDGKSNQEVWSSRIIEQFEAGITSEAVLLVNANTEAKWFQPLYDYPICLTNHRIRFYNTEGNSSQPTQGNALVYFGHRERRFIELFKCFGVIVKRIDR